MAHLAKAIDELRVQEAKWLRADDYELILSVACWLSLKRPDNLSEGQEVKLSGLVQYNLKSIRSYLLKEEFHVL